MPVGRKCRIYQELIKRGCYLSGGKKTLLKGEIHGRQSQACDFNSKHAKSR